MNDEQANDEVTKSAEQAPEAASSEPSQSQKTETRPTPPELPKPSETGEPQPISETSEPYPTEQAEPEAEEAPEPADAPVEATTQPAMLPPPVRGFEGQLDPRRHAFRPDLAADNLRGIVEAERFTAGNWAQVIIPCAQIRNKPGLDAPVDTEALFGEVLVVYDIVEGWAWVQILRDGYVGYTSVDAISADVEWPTHRVKSLGTFVYPEPDIKKPPLAHLSLNSALRIAERVDDFYKLTSGGYVHMRHVAPEENFARDFVDVAERFLGTPYLWGGRSRLGIDCSGLVQVSMEAAGFTAPRDSDMQRAEVGDDVLIREDYEGLQRGDLVFWPGHVGIMVDGLMLLHANAHHMAVTLETLPEAIERIARNGSRPTAIKRVERASV
ncbi:MAG: C40 family peptidase [Filomicrobium sp.]